MFGDRKGYSMARASRYEDVKHDVLRTVRAAEVAHGKPPTVRTLATTHEVSVSTMHSYLTRLAEEGMVEWTPGRHRSLRLTRAASQLS